MTAWTQWTTSRFRPKESRLRNRTAPDSSRAACSHARRYRSSVTSNGPHIDTRALFAAMMANVSSSVQFRPSLLRNFSG